MHKKGARVEWTDRGTMHYGTVVKGGARVAVVEDGDLKHEVRGPATAFNPSTKALPQDDPSSMDRYTVKNYRELRGEETRCFECEIHGPNGIIFARNSGTGGSNTYFPKAPGRAVRQLYDDAKAWATQFGYADMSEPDDWWLEWYQHQRPFGVLAKVSIGELKADLDKYRSPSA